MSQVVARTCSDADVYGIVCNAAVPPAFLQTIEQSAVSSWIRDSSSLFGFWFVISVHAIGMALLVGASAVIDLRILGVAKDLPLAA